MKFIDFFSGVGGIRLGLEQAGHECVGFCEWDKFARTAYKAMYDTEGEWECHDVRTASSMELPKADLWCFGFPCQDISVAGKQKGLQEGERSGLFYEVMRLLAGLRKEDRPQWILIENVKNLLSIGGGFDFARLLVEVGGYGYSTIEWQLINSKDFGVPQNRERVFIVGHLGNGSGRKVFPITPADGENPCKLQELTSRMTPISLKRPFGKSISDMKINKFDLETAHCVLARDYKGFGNESNGVLLYPAKVVKPYGSTGGIGGVKFKENSKDIAGPITARDYKGILRNDGDAIVEVRAVCMPDYHENRQNGRRIKDEGEPMFTLTAQDRHGVAIAYDEPKVIGGVGEKTFGKQYPQGNRIYDVEHISPALQAKSGNASKGSVLIGGVGLPIREATKQGYSVAYPGDGVNIGMPNSTTRRGRVNHGLANTLTTASEMCVVDPAIRIRRLTPRECWRLQGFPDEYFDKAKYKKERIYFVGGEDICCAKLKAATEKPKLFDMETCALCTTKDMLDMEMSTMMENPSKNEHCNEQILNVNIVMIKSENMAHLECAVNIIKCIDFMGMRCTMIKSQDPQVHTDIIVSVRGQQGNTEKYMRITTMCSLPLDKLYTILTLLKLIIELKIFTSTTLEANMQGFMRYTTDLEGNILLKISNLEMEHIMQRTSDSALYKMAGNAVSVPVAKAIGLKLREIEDEEAQAEKDTL